MKASTSWNGKVAEVKYREVYVQAVEKHKSSDNLQTSVSNQCGLGLQIDLSEFVEEILSSWAVNVIAVKDQLRLLLDFRV